ATVTADVNIQPPPDFSVPSMLGSATLSAGQSANFQMSVGSLSGFQQPVTFTCSGAAAGATCSVHPDSVTPGSASTVQVVVNTASRATALPAANNVPAPPPLKLIVLLGIMGTLLLAFRLTGPRRLALSAPALLLAIMSVGCGGGGGGGSVNP